MGDFVADDDAEVSVGLFFLFAVEAAAVVEVRALADVALVFVGPADEATITIFGLHGGSVSGLKLVWQ
jgi:hypothetical protein